MEINRTIIASEQAMEILNRRAKSSNVVITSRVSLLLDYQVVREAVNLAQIRHHILNYRILGSLDQLCFEYGETPKIPLRLVRDFAGDIWQDLVRAELNTSIDSDQVLMRMLLVHPSEEKNNSYLIMTIHHAICDGLSALELHGEILQYCQEIISEKSVIPRPSLGVFSSLKQLSPQFGARWQQKIRGILLLLRIRWEMFYHKPKALQFEQYVPVESRRCGIVHRVLPASFINQLIKRCREEKTTVQGAIMSAMLLAVAQKIFQQENLATACLNCHSYVDLRKYLQPQVNKEHLAMLVSMVRSFHTINFQTSFWDLAREARQTITTKLKGNDIFTTLLISRKLAEKLLEADQLVPATISVSNVGQVSLDPKKLPHLEEISFAVGQSAYGGMLLVSAATFSSQLVLNLVFSEPSISQQTAETVMDDSINYLQTELGISNK